MLAGFPSSPEAAHADVATYPCLGAPAGEPAGGVYPEPRIFFESQSWWTQAGEVFPGRHIHTGACIPWLQPIDGVVQYHVRNLLHGMPGTVTKFRLQVWNNGPDPALTIPLARSCSSHDCTFWDSFTVDYAWRAAGRWEQRFTHDITVNAFGVRQFTTTRWHVCVRTCTGGGTEAYTRAAGAASWYQGLDYANAYLDPDDYARIRAGLPPGQHRIKIKFDPGSGSLTVDPDAHNGNAGIVQRRASDGLVLGGLLPVSTGTAWFEAILDTTALSPGVHKLALRGSSSNATGREEGVLLVPFIVTGTGPPPPPPPPVAAFTASLQTGDAPLKVNLADTSTGGPTDWLWDFGDGATSTAQAPGSHTYAAEGTYTLSLTVNNAIGPASTATRTITVDPPPPPTPPGAAFTASPQSGTVPLVVNLADTSTGGPTDWLWDFGDGATSTAQDPGSHTYTAAGTYVCSLTVDNEVGPADTTTRTITVDPPPPPPPPGAAFTASPQSGTVPLVVNLADTSTGGPTAWLWDFGDGATSTAQDPGSHTYTAAGTYTLSLTVDNAVGPASTASKTITVDPPPPPPPPPTGRIKDITFDPTLLDPVHGVDKVSGTVTRETATPLAGPGSAKIANNSAYVEETFAATDDVFTTFRLKLNAIPSASPRVFMVQNGGTTQANLVLTSAGRLQLRVGSTNVGALSIALNTTTTYIIGIRQRRGTGSNALVEAYVAPVGTAFGAPFASRTNGTWRTAADRLRIGATNSSAVNIVFDNVLIDRSSMPVTPAP